MNSTCFDKYFKKSNTTKFDSNSTQFDMAKSRRVRQKDGNFVMSNAMWNHFKSHLTAKMSKGRTMSKTTCAFKFNANDLFD